VPGNAGMSPDLLMVVFAVGLFPAFMLAAEVGRRRGLAYLARDPDGLPKGTGAAEASIYAVIGLILAFSFSGADARFEKRRHLIMSETNAIGTAYMQLDLLPEPTRSEVRKDFLLYLDSRIAMYQEVHDRAAIEVHLKRTAEIKDRIWKKSVASTLDRGSHPNASTLLLPTLREMFDIATTRWLALTDHPPIAILLLLTGMNMIGAMLCGFATSVNKRRPWFYIWILASVLSVTQYVIVDLEFPRIGLIRLDSADHYLVELRRSLP
jgi:hypothetical protein